MDALFNNATQSVSLPGIVFAAKQPGIPLNAEYIV